MPLPPALLARLQKRGIVKEKTQPPLVNTKQDEEEVFAEDYDDLNEATQKPADTPVEIALPEPVVPPEDAEDDIIHEAVLIHEVIACPNKSNIYHECVNYCRLRWGMKAFEPDNTMLRRRARMLDKYPLSESWQEVADPHTARYYYWNTQTHEVSWLSPSHPRAVISISADKLMDMAKQQKILLDEEGMEKADSTDESGGEHSSDEEGQSDEEKRRQKSRSLRDKRGRQREDELDPMDPSSYSDVARGSWSSGLDMRGSAKTGVDHTVSGPLFQQRPYPSPGDILRANRQMAEKK